MKKNGKKFFACFLILVIFAGVVFFFGWTQFKIKPNQFGILSTKTSGLQEKIIDYGTFKWDWELLLPTNADLKLFQLNPYRFEYTSSGKLPASDIYRNSMSDKFDFSYSMKFTVETNIDKEAVFNLVKNSRINSQEELSFYINDACTQMVKILTNKILYRKEINQELRPELMTTEELYDLSQFSQIYPLLKFNFITISDVSLPDFTLYNKVRNEFIQNVKYEDPIIIYANPVAPDQQTAVFNKLLKTNDQLEITQQKKE